MVKETYNAFRIRGNALLTAQHGGRAGYFVDWFIMTLIVANVIAVMLETVDPLYEQYSLFFTWFELFSVAVFTTEYVVRIWTCTVHEEYRHPIVGRVNFARRPMLIVDLLAILPFFLGPLIPADLRFLRALRLFRFFRLFKLVRYTDSMAVFQRVYYRKKADLVVAFAATTILLIISSSMMYIVETSAHPDSFSSIPESLWWGVITLTTVGYGDVSPVTPAGKVIGGIVAILGVGLFGLPASILAAGFIEEIDREKSSTSCPHCGERLDD